ncbi:MAG: hydrolase [Chromatiaceae bacterium]|nr:hydrolase [Gammaproteobacteria bacterium]MCB1879354.1 hydrolase [Gammaproteobacteria bacterium]MCP5448927.1 hydrolase [Chromatiaceae bacterium]
MIRNSGFKPAWWLPGPHLQTIWPVFFRRRRRLPLRIERVELPDRDFLDLAWLKASDTAPQVLLLHGLEGNIQSHYAAGLLHSLWQAGFNAVFMHFRGCSGVPNRLPRGYHSGETGDLSTIVEHIEQRTASPVRAIVGFSLGGNVLLKWLGEGRARSTLKKAVAISVPFLLGQCADRLDRGASRLYRSYLLRKMRSSYLRKFALLQSPLAVNVNSLKTFRDFDDKVTAPLHGFNGVDHYYAESSSRQYLHRIHTDTLLLHALDDPFMLPETIPAESELSSTVTLELSAHGGHVGFIAGPMPWNARYWLDERVLAYFSDLR